MTNTDLIRQIAYDLGRAEAALEWLDKCAASVTVPGEHYVSFEPRMKPAENDGQYEACAYVREAMTDLMPTILTRAQTIAAAKAEGCLRTIQAELRGK